MWPRCLKRTLLQHPSVFTSIWAVFFDSAFGREPQNNILIAHPKKYYNRTLGLMHFDAFPVGPTAPSGLIPVLLKGGFVAGGGLCLHRGDTKPKIKKNRICFPPLQLHCVHLQTNSLSSHMNAHRKASPARLSVAKHSSRPQWCPFFAQPATT